MATVLPDSIAEDALALIAAAGETVYVSLHFASPGKTGLNEISGTGYARVAIVVDTDLNAAADDAPSGGRVRDNVGAVDFGTAGSAWGTISHFGVWTALSGGTWRGGTELLAPQTIASGNPVKFQAGDLDIVGAGI